MYEYEIDLKDLMFAVFRKWRPIMLIAFTVAFMLGGFKCVKELLNQNNEEYVLALKEKYESDLDQYEQTQRAYERDIDNLTASIDYQEKYKEKSILLKTDPYNKGIASVDVFVKMSELPDRGGVVITSVDFADGVVKAYASAIQQGGALEGLADDMGIDLIYLKELVKVTTDYDSNMLNVSITYPDQKGAEVILTKILGSVDYMNPKIQDNLGVHSIIIMNQNVGVVTDQSLADYQKQKVDDLYNTNQKLKDTEKALDELEKPEKPVVLSNISILKEGIRFGVIGWFVGAFLLVGALIISYMLNDRISADNDLKNRYGWKLLGSFSEREKKKTFSKIDNWLDNLEGKERISDESVYDMIATNIRNYNNSGQSIFITGTVGEDMLNNFIESIQKRLPDFKLGYGVDMNRNILTLQSVAQYDQVVLVEARRKSKFREIEKEIELILNLKKAAMGYVILDSDKE